MKLIKGRKTTQKLKCKAGQKQLLLTTGGHRHIPPSPEKGQVTHIPLSLLCHPFFSHVSPTRMSPVEPQISLSLQPTESPLVILLIPLSPIC